MARAWALEVFFPTLEFTREYGWSYRRVLDRVGEVRATCLGNRSWSSSGSCPLSSGQGWLGSLAPPSRSSLAGESCGLISRIKFNQVESDQ